MPPNERMVHGLGHDMTTKMDISPSAFAPAGESLVATPADKPASAVFRCTFPGCGREFMLKGNLKRHQNIHSGDRKFACKQCDRAFFRKADLEVHYRVHTGEKPYACKHQHCDKRFARRSDLLSHERTHLYVVLAHFFLRFVLLLVVLTSCVFVVGKSRLLAHSQGATVDSRADLICTSTSACMATQLIQNQLPKPATQGSSWIQSPRSRFGLVLQSTASQTSHTRRAMA